MQTAQINYAIIFSHRSGSSLLCNLLSQTNIAGTPDEFFLHWQGRAYKNYDISDYPAYINRVIQESQTNNLVFGIKTLTSDFLAACNRLEAFPNYKNRSNAEKIRILFPNIKFIYLTRRHKVRQAISWWKAAQTD